MQSSQTDAQHLYQKPYLKKHTPAQNFDLRLQIQTENRFINLCCLSPAFMIVLASKKANTAI